MIGQIQRDRLMKENEAPNHRVQSRPLDSFRANAGGCQQTIEKKEVHAEVEFARRKRQTSHGLSKKLVCLEASGSRSFVMCREGGDRFLLWPSFSALQEPHGFCSLVDCHLDWFLLSVQFTPLGAPNHPSVTRVGGIGSTLWSPEINQTGDVTCQAVILNSTKINSS